MSQEESGRWTGDQALAARCLAGEEAAWRELVARYGGRIYAHCRMGGLAPADAEDVTQEVLISLLSSLGTYRGCALSTWLYRLTRRRIADHYRSPQRRMVPVEEPRKQEITGAPAARSGLESSAAAAVEAARARQTLGKLPEPTRSILTAYYLYETPVREIAGEMKMPINTVKSHLHRGRKALRSMLEERHDL